ncbi:MAG: hypothetical protein PUI16_00295 [Clostridia bacterium]|nr:hypothetical protein [Clostridia bacterium]MDY5555103.1 hypothetical protein [Blautia sp.]
MAVKPEDYADIIDTQYPFELKHVRMDRIDRAAQFASFKALSGYEEEISETARTTDARTDLDETARNCLDMKLQVIEDRISQLPVIDITYFVPDEKKSGGQYRKITARIRKVDEYTRSIVTVTGQSIRMDDICGLEGEIFRDMDL